METLVLSEYRVAFLIGLAVIWIFAWKQFTQPSYERYRRFDAILLLLRPQDLRSNGVFFPAYIFYALILSAIYWILCTFGSLQLLNILGLSVLGIDSPGESVGAILQSSDASVLVDLSASGAVTSDVIRVFQAERDIPQNPTVPLTIALALVGVIPNIPVFVKFEEKLRIVAHRLAGIPGRLFEGTRHLVGTDLSAEGSGTKGAGAPGDLRVMLGASHDRFEAAARLIHRDPAVVEKLFRKIYFFRDLVAGSGSRIAWPSYSVHGAYQRVSDEIIKNINVLKTKFDKVKEIADLTDLTDPQSIKLADDKRSELSGLWDDLVATAQQIENDICVLMLVYAEKDGVPNDKTTESKKLREFILSAHHAAARDTVSFNVFTHVLITIVLVSGLFGLVFGFDPALGSKRDVNIVINYIVTAVMMYSLASIIALTFRQLTADTTWSNPYEEHWIKGTVQLVIVFLLAVAVSFASMCVWNIYVLVESVGNIRVVGQWHDVVRAAALQEWPQAIQGGVFAVFLVLGMDYWDRGSNTLSHDGSPLPGASARPAGVGPALIGGLLLGIWAAAARMIVAWQNDAQLDTTQMVQQACLAFLIGTISGAVVQATLAAVYIRPASTRLQDNANGDQVEPERQAQGDMA